MSKINGNSLVFPKEHYRGKKIRISGSPDEDCVHTLLSVDYINNSYPTNIQLRDYGKEAIIFVNKVYDHGVIVEDPVLSRNATSILYLDRSKDIYPLTSGNCDVIYFDAEQNYLSSVQSYAYNPVLKETFPLDACFVAFNYYRDTLLGDGSFHAINYEPKLGYILFPSESIVASKGRPIININAADTEETIFLKMVRAFYLGNCDVVWEKAEYHFSKIYKIMKDELGWTWTMEIPIGGGCRYFFNGSSIVADYPDNYDDCMNIFGCKGFGGESFELHDATLINNGGTYCVHDEAGNGPNEAYSH